MGTGASCHNIIKTVEKECGKKYLDSLLSKVDLFGRKELLINLKSPDFDFELSQRILNTELLKHILHDFYPNKSKTLKVTLNGYTISKEKSLKDNLVQENDDLFIYEPFEIYFSIIDKKTSYPLKISPYQIFYDVFEEFYNNICPSEYKNKIYEAYYNGEPIKPFELMWNLGIQNNDIIHIMLGHGNNIKSQYNEGIEALNRINFRYFNEDNKIKTDDYKLELKQHALDDIELKNLGNIYFKNLKILNLTECKIQNLDFLNAYSFISLQEINLQKNNISYFVDLTLYKLEKLDLSHNNLKGTMINSILSDNNTYIRLDKILTLNFPCLKKLNLSFNKIVHINLLTQFNSPELLELDLSYNEIKSIDSLQNVAFGKLIKLNLRNNNIKEIKIFDKLPFYNIIREINLMNNDIANLNDIREVNFSKLKILNLLNNDIDDFSVLKYLYIPELEILYAYPTRDKIDNNPNVLKIFKESCKHIIEKNVEVKYKL